MPSFTPFEGVIRRVTKLFQNKGKQSERGATLITFTFVSFFLVIPVIGLAIDGAIVMWEKARLSASVDAAALAAGRGLSVGSDIPTAIIAAKRTARDYFKANFQPGTMGTVANLSDPGVPPPVAGLWTIDVDATSTVPLYFTRLLGFNQATISAHAETTRRNVNIMVVLDRSASLVIFSSSACSSLKASAQNFTNMFVGGQDVLGLITFQTVANVDFTPGTDFKSRTPNMSQVIGQLNCSGYTNTVSALKLAYDQITKVINQPLALNVIVFFSDGKPDAITADFLAKQKDSRDDVPYPFNTLPNSPASNCRTGVTPMRGVLVAMDEFTDPTGPTLGVIPAPDPTCYTCGPPISSLGDGLWGLLPKPISSSLAPGCTFSDPNASSTMQYSPQLYCTGSSCDVRKDIQAIPKADIFGNSTSTSYRPLTVANFGLFPNNHYSTDGFIRPDTPAGVVNAALNAAFEQVKTIRRDNYKITIYSIGLGGYSGQQYIDTGFMQDVANDPNAPNYDPSSPSGQYIYAPSASQLSSAFQQIASQVLRISH